MPCKQCGYILGQFDLECPECARQRARERATASAKPRLLSFFKDSKTGESFEPPFDWPATIILVITCLISGMAVLFWLFALITSHSTVNTTGSGRDVMHVFSHWIVQLSLLFIGGFSGKIAGAAGFMQFKRWGFYLFLPCSVVTGLLNIIVGFSCMNIIWLIVLLIFDALPAYIVYYIGSERSEEFN